MIDQKKRDQAIGSLLAKKGPRLSVYLPTHRSFPDNRQDPILYKNLLQQLEGSLNEALPRRDWEKSMEALKGLLDDTDLWTHTAEGLGVLAAEGQAVTFDLEAPAGPLAQFGEHYYLQPLYPLMDSIGQAYLADLSRDRFALFLVSRDGVVRVEEPQIKSSFPELFDDFDAEKNRNTGSSTGEAGGKHDYRNKSEEIRKDKEKYFRYLDGALANVSKASGLPIILTGTDAVLSEYRQLMKGNFYLEGMIKQPLESMDAESVIKEAKVILKPHLEKGLDSLRTLISNKRKEGKTAFDIKDILTAAQQGRVDILILPAAFAEGEEARLHQAAEQVLLNGGQLHTDFDSHLDLPGGRLALLR